MRDKRIKLIYFSLKGSEINYIELSWKKIFLLASALLVFLFVFVGSVIGLFTNYYHDSRIESLDKVNLTLRSQLLEMTEKVVRVQTKMEELEKNDDEERLIAGLDKIDKDMRSVGVGGTDFGFSEELVQFSTEMREEVSSTQSLIDQLERRVQLLVESKSSLDKKVREDRENLAHTPSIRPVRKGRISDTFGMRNDPFVDKVKMHKGLDIAARQGTPVVAAAAGTVIRVEKTYRPNKGYGKRVVIDHGGKIRTVYAHLHKIYVRQGQKVKRWERIATVGKTGRATGPHLHYEVVVNNKQVDPINYFLEN